MFCSISNIAVPFEFRSWRNTCAIRPMTDGCSPSDISSTTNRRGPHHDGARDDEHLLLAAGQGASLLRQSLFKERENSEYAADLVAERPVVGGREAQVVPHRQILKDRFFLGSMRNTIACHDVRSRSGHVVAAYDNGSVPRRQESQDGSRECWSCPCRSCRAARQFRRGRLSTRRRG
jgi:hypothetical protein